MKKLLFLLLSLAVATGASAGVTAQSTSVKKFDQSRIETVKKERVNFKSTHSIQHKDVLAAPVTERPAGESKFYTRAGNALYVDGQYITAGVQDGDVEIIYADNNVVWIKNILYGCEGAYGDSYVQGTLSNDGSKITVPLGQSIYWSNTYQADVVLAWGTSSIDGNSIVFTRDNSVTNAEFAINGNVITMLNTQDAPTGSAYPEYEGKGLGSYWTDDDSFGALLDWNTVWTFYVPAFLPTNVEVTPSDFNAQVTWDGNENDNWNLRWRPYVDTSGNPISQDFGNEENYMEKLEGWSVLDADGDDDTWYLAAPVSADDLCMASDSYYQGVLTPDNWLIAPLTKLQGKIEYKAWHRSSYNEKLEIMIGLEDAIEGNTVYINQFTTVQSITTAANTKAAAQTYTFDLSSYDGAMGYVVFRHFGTSDQWTLYIDDVFIGDANAEYVEPAEWTYVNGLTEPRHRIDYLMPETEYEVQVMSYNNEGSQTGWTNSVIFTTLPEQNNVYIIGEVNNIDWAANNGVQMDFENGVYTATVTFDGRNMEGSEEVNYFALTKKLANDNDEGGWSYVNQNRLGSETDGDFWVTPELMGQELGLLFPYEMSYRIAAGEYKLTVDLEAMTLVIEDLNPAPQGLRGDVDNSGDVAIADVSALIDYLLSGDASGINLQNADCDLSGQGTPDVTIADVSALIDYLLNGEW